MRNKRQASRVLSLAVLLLMLINIAPLSVVEVVAADSDAMIEGPVDITINRNDWANKLSSHIFSYIGEEPGEWDVTVSKINTTEEVSVEEVDYISWYQINEYQVMVVIDASKFAGTAKDTFDIYVKNGDIILCSVATVDNLQAFTYAFGFSVNIENPINAPSQGNLYYAPLSAFYCSGVMVENIDIENVVITPPPGGIGGVKISENKKVLEVSSEASGIYELRIMSGDYLKVINLVIVNDDPQIYAKIFMKESYELVESDIPLQIEDPIQIPFIVSVYNGVMIDPSYKWRAVLSPTGPGLSIEGNSLLIKYTAISGEYKIRIMPEKSSTIIGEITIKLTKKENSYILINAADIMTIPSFQQTSTIITGTIFKNGQYITNEPIEWSINSYYNGVSMSENYLIINPIAQPGIITINARLKSDPTIYGQKNITLRAADKTIKPEAIYMTGILNNTWRPNSPSGNSVNVSIYGTVKNIRQEGIELGLRLINPPGGFTIVSSGGFNQFEIWANGVYGRTTLTLEAYSLMYPDITQRFTINVHPVIEGLVYSSSQITKRGIIEAHGMVVVNAATEVDAVMIISIYKGEKLLSITPHSKENKNEGDADSLITLEGSVQLPSDIEGVYVKITLYKGKTPADSGEPLAEPIIIR